MFRKLIYLILSALSILFPPWLRERFTDPNLSVRGGIPILFPICGNLPEGTYTDRGQTYKLKQHGFDRDLPWTVSQVNEADASITLTLASNDQTLAVYPFEFELKFTFEQRLNHSA